LAADATWREYRCQLERSDRRGRNGGVVEDLRAYFGSHIERGQPLPGHRGLPNWRFISAAVGVSRRSLDRPQNRELIDDALSKVGVTEYTWLPVAITALSTGRRGSTVLQCDTLSSPSKDWRGYCRSAATS
jgi:hypothetical protein